MKGRKQGKVITMIREGGKEKKKREGGEETRKVKKERWKEKGVREG
jgi:hypothetical protein